MDDVLTVKVDVYREYAIDQISFNSEFIPILNLSKAEKLFLLSRRYKW